MNGLILCRFKRSCCKELWDDTYLPLVKDGSVYPMLKEIRKEASKHLCLALRELEPLHLDTFGPFHSVRNLPKPKIFSDRNLLL